MPRNKIKARKKRTKQNIKLTNNKGQFDFDVYHTEKTILLFLVSLLCELISFNRFSDVIIFSRGQATPHLAVSVGPSVRRSVRW